MKWGVYLRAQYQTLAGVGIAIVIALGIGLGVTFLPSEIGASSAGPTLTSPLTNTTLFNSSTSTYLPPRGCAQSYQGGYIFNVSEGSNLLLCVDFYYYSSSPANIDPVSALAINAQNTTALEGPSYPGRNALSNFTITAQPSNFSIGGPSNENEGIPVEFNIHPHPVSNGTYVLDLGWLAPQVRNCNAEFELVVGNGFPNYFIGGYCEAMTVTGGNASGLSAYPNTLFAQITGWG